MALFEELNRLMVKYSFKPNKKFGQSFLIDESVIKVMVEAAELKADDVVLEIGSGTGFLTRELLKKSKVIGTELDSVLSELLAEEFKDQNLTLLQGNFLELKLPEFNKVVSCPPYNISTEIMYKLFVQQFERAVLLFQREFVEKITALPGFPNYVATTVLTNYFFQPTELLNVSARSFFPSPKMSSTVIKLDSVKRFGQVKDEKLFIKFVKSLFRFKGKSLRNSLLTSYPFLEKELKKSKEEFKQFVESLELKEEKVYSLDCSDFVEVFNALQA
jgi:16S rRNA (adenine1518-N6/adenine1519-N6)-dimethyltransferase